MYSMAKIDSNTSTRFSKKSVVCYNYCLYTYYNENNGES